MQGDTRDVCVIPGSGRSSGGGNGNPLQNSCQENPMDSGALWAAVHRIAKIWTQLNTVYIIYIYTMYAAATAKLLQSCPTLCDTIDGSPPGSHVPGILQARVLEWGAIALSDI